MGEPVYNADARNRIDRTVLRVEGDPLGLREIHPEERGGQRIFLVRATEDVSEGTVGAFQILWPNGNKGDEIDGEDEDVDCYVRDGDVNENDVRLAVAVCGADDSLFEIINPTAGDAQVTFGHLEDPDHINYFVGDPVVGTAVMGVGFANTLHDVNVNAGMLLEGEVYAILRTGTDYYVLNPSLTFVGKAISDIGSEEFGDVQVYRTYLIAEDDAIPCIDGPGSIKKVFNRTGGTVVADSWAQADYVAPAFADFFSETAGWEISASGGGGQAGGTNIVLAVCTGYGVAGQLATFTILEPSGGNKGSEVPTGAAVLAYVRKGIVLVGQVYQLASVCEGADAGFDVLNPELEFFAISTGTTLANGTGTFTTPAGDVLALVPFGIVLQQQICFLAWSGVGLAVQNPQTAVTGLCIAFQNATNGTADFSVESQTVTARLTRGLVLSEKQYGLIWADAGHFAVIDPELSAFAIADDYYFAGDTGTFDVSGAAFQASVKQGMIFLSAEYQLDWKDNHWEVTNPALRFRGKANAAILLGATTGKVSIHKWGGSSWVDTDVDLTNVLNDLDGNIQSGAVVRCEAVEPTRDRWAIYQADCPV